MANKSKCLVALISLANVLIVILAIIIMCLSLGCWNDYVTCTFTILIALCWSCCVCVENNVAISCYSVLMILDMLFLLANAIYHSVMNKQYMDYCFRFDNDKMSPDDGCDDWKRGHMHRSIGVIVCFFLTFLFRLFNIVGSCLLAHSLYES